VDFSYTFIPVNPEDKTPALSAGFKYESIEYGSDLRSTDLRQAGHITSRSARLFVIDVDDLAAFLDTHLGNFLVGTGDFMSLITYASAADPNKKHLYFSDPDNLLGEDWPVQWASKFPYDIKSNGFVRAEPAYVPSGNGPTDIALMDDLAFFSAIEADKQEYRAATRKSKDKYVSAPTGDIQWEDWHEDDGTTVSDFTCDYEDALTIAGQLRNYHEHYDAALSEFCWATYESDGYTGESWEETFERLWHSMEPYGGMSVEQRQREDREWIERGSGLDGSDSSWEKFSTEKSEEAEQRAVQFSEHEQAQYDYQVAQQRYVPVEDEESGFFQYEPAEVPDIPGGDPNDEFRKSSTYQTQFARERAIALSREDIAKFNRDTKAARWEGFTNPFDEEDPPAPSMFKIVGSDLNSASAAVIENTVSVVFGARGGGKTWTSAVWAAQELRAGKHVMWLDFERQAQLMKQKLRALGVPEGLAREFFHYSGGGLPPVGSLIQHVQEWGGGLVVIDSFRDIMGEVAARADSNDGEVVQEVYREFLDPLIHAGATLCLIDHEAKSGNGSAFGSERKESKADYVIRVEQKIPFTSTQSGFAVLTMTKDRYGITPHGTVVGALWVGGDDGKKGQGIKNYPDVPEIRCWAPTSEAQEAYTDHAASIEQRRQEYLVRYLEQQGARDGVVEMEQMILCRNLLAVDAERDRDLRAWVKVSGDQDPLDEKSVKNRVLEVVKNGAVIKNATPVRNVFGWELPRITAPVPGTEKAARPEALDVPWESEESPVD
jgi:hypothetical protein